MADLLFEVLIARLTQSKSEKGCFYQQRKGFKIESKGPRYELGDFIIKIGSVSLASNFKGILMEVRPKNIELFLGHRRICFKSPALLFFDAF